MEVGYTLNRHYWRQGLGIEVLQALCRLAFDKLAAQTVQATVVSDNQASVALLEKCGFQKISEDKQASNSRGQNCLMLTYELKAERGQ